MKQLAQAGDIVGSVGNPLTGGYANISGVGLFISNILRLFFVVAGIYALFNFIIAGYTYMNAAGDAKKLTEAWNKIWLSLIGLVIIVGSFALAALVGYLLFNDPTYIFNPKVYGPND